MKSSFPLKISLDQYIFIHRTLRDALFNCMSKENILELIKNGLEIVKIYKEDNNYLIELQTSTNLLDTKYIYIMFKPKRIIYTIQLTSNNSYTLNCWINKKQQKIILKEIELTSLSISKILKLISSHKKVLFPISF
jgi:hypothetical protein